MLPALAALRVFAPRVVTAALIPVAIVVGYLGSKAEETLQKDKHAQDAVTPKTAFERREERKYQEMVASLPSNTASAPK